MVVFHDPRGQAATEPLPYTLSHPVTEGTRVALMANGFPDSVEFLDALAVALADHVPNATFHRFNKGNASALASEAMLDDAAHHDVVVAAYGH